MVLAIMTTRTSVTQTMAAMASGTRSMTRSFTKLAAERVMPQSTATRISFHIASKMSLNSISFSERPRMIETEAWEPAFPPVSISIGM